MADQLEQLKAALAGRYEILRELGAGGMATVYLAHDPRHDRQVALKVLRPDLAASLGPDRFLNEIRIAAKLTHPHILPVHDSGEAGGFLYYVMPYIEGESLRDKIAREGELPVPEAARILRDIVDALALAHANGVVHRDIKPDNVMLAGRHALVVDFGVAKAVSEAAGAQQLTTVGVALGTPHYMAPEQAAADPHVDHRADLYAVGIMGYELLAGRPPFAGTTPQQILASHVTQVPDPVTKWRSSVPPALAQLIMRCLEKKPADRWQRAEELLPVLEALTTPSGGITPTDTQPFAAEDVSLGSLVRKVGWGRLVRVMAVYLVASLAALQGVSFLINQLGLPGWFIPAGVVLLLMGLPIIMATALIQAAALPAGAAPRAAPPWRAPHRWFTWNRAILGGVLAFAALVVAGLGMVWARNKGHELKDNVVAVLPFDAVGGDLSFWREGLLDLLGTALDGTGRLQASDPRAVLNSWRQVVGDDADRPAPGQAAAVAKHLGAGLMIQGSIIATGPDDVRVTAELYNVRWLRKEGSVTIDGHEGDMTGLVDQLSVELLKSIWQAEEIPEIRVSAVTTSSVPALRAYLEGEQAFRRSRFVDAREAFIRALDIDSTFAIAAHRLSISYGWSLGSFPQEHLQYAALAARHLAGLPERDSLLILGHKLVDFDGDLSVLPIYQRLTEAYPEDFEAWYGLGEAYFHLGGQAGYSPASVVETLERAYALDSTLAPAVIHLVQAAHQLDDSALVDQWTTKYLMVDSTSASAQAFRLARSLRFGSRDDSVVAAQALDTASAAILGELGRGVLAGRRTLGLMEQAAAARTDARFSDGQRAGAMFDLSSQYLRHGQLTRWWEIRSRAEQLLGQEGGLFLLSMTRLMDLLVTPEPLERFEALALNAAYPESATYLGLLAAKDGRYGEAESAVTHLDTRADSLLSVGDSIGSRTARGLALAYRAHIASARDSADVAIDLLRRALPMISANASGRDVHRYLLATLVQDHGDEAGALRIFESLYWSPWLEALGYLRAAELHERRGDRDMALRDYGFFIELWQDADAHLESEVNQVRAAMQRLTQERAE
jgi:tRNA A-37 threonylcarbamoyl transferase component Bud32/tetratricopeptide (TPR) repeat protein